MAAIHVRNGVIFENTNLVIPRDLKLQARENGISLSKLLIKSLENELKPEK